GAKRVVVLGTGGSSLGAQVLVQINGWGTPASGMVKASGPEMIFADNLDGQSFDLLLDEAQLAHTKFIVVSKSGGTAETMMQLSCALTALKKAGLDTAKHVSGIAGSGSNTLRDVAERAEFPLLPHADGIGGRFAVLTNVGLLPALLMGVDPISVRQGASEALSSFMEAPVAEIPSAIGAAMQIAHAGNNRNISVLMPYTDRLERLGFWYRQLWAESLGKDGQGTCPVNALGPVDQHSQVQLYLGGPDDKLYNLITAKNQHPGPKALAEACDIPELSWLQGRSIGELVAAEAIATFTALKENARPVRHIKMQDVTGHSVGYILMHFMLETIIAAGLMDIDAFDQPAVEQGKIIAKKLMSESSN
ncbi:MAG TPA: glucose-6-phosphate isomerase, partial [Rhodobiaceae bacterium]|nr:glucose-6-phosphate isomerase [Rhodobiaceae bacterium]